MTSSPSAADFRRRAISLERATMPSALRRPGLWIGSFILLANLHGSLLSDDDVGGDAPAPSPPAPGSSKTSAQGPKSPAEEKIDVCLSLRRTRRYDEAFAALQQAAALQPSPVVAAQIVFRTGETQFRKAQDAASGKLQGVDSEACLKEAIRSFELLGEKHPKDEITPEGVYMTGSAYLLLGDLEKALQLYRRAAVEYPAYTGRGKSLMRVGVCQAGLDDPASARTTFRKYLQEFPSPPADASKVRKYLSELELVGKPAPALRVTSWLTSMVGPDGLKTFDGEVVVVVFFATWCENCSAEMPHLRSLINTWSPRGVVFLGVSDPDDPKNTSSVPVYVQKNEIPFLDVGLDRGSQSSPAYKVTGLPGAALIDRKGNIRWRGHLAFLPRPLLEKALAEK